MSSFSSPGGSEQNPRSQSTWKDAGRAAEEAAAWVEYCNSDAHSKYGSMRSANGSPEPFHVRYWEIGNEIWGDWVRGHSDAQTYAKNLNRYVEKMRAVDPSITIIATGDNDLKWNETVLRIAGNNIDYLSVHHYYGQAEMKGDANNLRARPLHYEQFYLQMKQMFQELVPGHKIKLAVNEWNTTLPLPAQHSMQSAIYAARLMNVSSVAERGSDERRIRHGERMDGRHNPGKPACSICHSNLPGESALRVSPWHKASGQHTAGPYIRFHSRRSGCAND